MRLFSCDKCGSTDVFIKKSGNHTGLYCGECGKWIKWLKKDEIRLVERQLSKLNEGNQNCESWKKEWILWDPVTKMVITQPIYHSPEYEN